MWVTIGKTRFGITEVGIAMTDDYGRVIRSMSAHREVHNDLGEIVGKLSYLSVKLSIAECWSTAMQVDKCITKVLNAIQFSGVQLEALHRNLVTESSD